MSVRFSIMRVVNSWRIVVRGIVSFFCAVHSFRWKCDSFSCAIEAISVFACVKTLLWTKVWPFV